MAQSGFAAFLLFLGLVVSNVYGENTTALCAQILNATLDNAGLSDFNLTVSPDKIYSNTNYIEDRHLFKSCDDHTVAWHITTHIKDLENLQLNGAGNFSILLQSVTLSGPVGNWSQENYSCDGSPLFIDYFLNGSHINTIWTSPVNVTNVTINAYIHNGTNTFLLHQTLIQESIPTTQTPTEAPTTASNTTNSTTASTVTVSIHQTDKTTSAGSIEQFSLVSMALSVILGLLLIPNKYLS